MAAYATFNRTRPPEGPASLDPALTRMVAEHQESNLPPAYSEPGYFVITRPLDILV